MECSMECSIDLSSVSPGLQHHGVPTDSACSMAHSMECSMECSMEWSIDLSSFCSITGFLPIHVAVANSVTAMYNLLAGARIFFLVRACRRRKTPTGRRLGKGFLGPSPPLIAGLRPRSGSVAASACSEIFFEKANALGGPAGDGTRVR